jgi:transposase
LGAKLGILRSPPTLLRRVHSSTPAHAATARLVGSDDWAIRKAQRSGSSLLDLQQHRPIALLAEHATAPFAQWFADPPRVEGIARDRASIYTFARMEY